MNAQDNEDLWEILNSTDPDKSLQEYLLIKKGSKRSKAAFTRRFREIYSKAKQDQIPMGIELKNCRNYEDAYLLRQRFLTRYFAQQDNFQTITALLILILIGLIFIIVTLIL